MQIILKKTVKNLGLVGDVVKVAPGYYRNYLAPRQLAFLANPKSLKQLEHEKKIIERKKEEAKQSSESVKEKIESQEIKILQAAGSGDRLFGSITSQQIAEKLFEAGFTDVDRKSIHLESPIKTLGVHEVPIKLHSEVIATIKVNVIRKGKAPDKKEKTEKKKEKKEKKEGKKPKVAKKSKEEEAPKETKKEKKTIKPSESKATKESKTAKKG